MITSEFYKVTPITNPKPILVSVPGSKSITNRALLLAALAEGTSTIHNVLFSDDSRHFLQCLKDLGFPVDIDEKNRRVQVTGYLGEIPKKEANIYVGSAGTAARFLTAMLGFSDGVYHLDASEQMRKRPMKPLLASLESIGVRIVYEEKEGFFPFTLYGSSKTTDSIQVDIKSSSQFLSALLMSAPMKKNGFTIELTGGSHALSYVNMTIQMMQQFGCEVHTPALGIYEIPSGKHFAAQNYNVEPDVSAACYFYAMTPLLQVSSLVRGVHFDSIQGDIRFLSILEKMGCLAKDTPEGVLLLPPASDGFTGLTVNMSDCSDQTMTLAAIAPFASSPVSIRGVEHIHLQECDRIYAICTELNRMGISCEEADTGIDIIPGMPKPALIETYEDHRVAMAFSLPGLRVPGITIHNPDCCKKTFEDYFDVLDSLIYQADTRLP